MVELLVNVLVPVKDPHHHQATISQIPDLRPILSTELLGTMNHIRPQGVIIVQIQERIPLPSTLVKTGLFTRNPLPMDSSLGNLIRSISIDNQISRYGHPDLKEVRISLGARAGVPSRYTASTSQGNG